MGKKRKNSTTSEDSSDLESTSSSDESDSKPKKKARQRKGRSLDQKGIKKKKKVEYTSESSTEESSSTASPAKERKGKKQKKTKADATDDSSGSESEDRKKTAPKKKMRGRPDSPFLRKNERYTSEKEGKSKRGSRSPRVEVSRPFDTNKHRERRDRRSPSPGPRRNRARENFRSESPHKESVTKGQVSPLVDRRSQNRRKENQRSETGRRPSAERASREYSRAASFSEKNRRRTPSETRSSVPRSRKENLPRPELSSSRARSPRRDERPRERQPGRGASRDRVRGELPRRSSEERRRQHRNGSDTGHIRVKEEPVSPERTKWDSDGEAGDFGKKEEKKVVKEKEKPNFGLSGKLAEETNTFRGVVIKYSEPPEARIPKRRWRFYVFKDNENMPTLYVHRQSAFLIGRDRKICDLPVDHPSCSKQHAVLQYRLVPYQKPDGRMGRAIRPYIIDLESSNGTFVNNKQIEAKRYVELREKDVVKFGFSSREYVLLHDESKDDELDDDYNED